MIRMRVAHRLLSLRACSRRFGPGLGVFRPIFPALRLRHGSLLSIPLRSVHPVAGSPAAAGPFFARIARGRGRPLAPARFARLIAPARASPSSGRTSPVSFSGVFSRRREPGKEAARADTASFLQSHISTDRLKSIPDYGFISYFMNKIVCRTPGPGSAGQRDRLMPAVSSRDSWPLSQVRIVAPALQLSPRTRSGPNTAGAARRGLDRLDPDPRRPG